jgi:hypothetical protein
MERYPISGLLKSHTPSARQRITNWMNQNMFGDTRQGQGKAERLMGVMDYTPLGVGTAAYDAGHAAASGNPVGAGLNMLAIVPPVAALRTPIKRGALEANELLQSAVRGTPNASIAEDGLRMRVQRNQLPQQSGEESVRGGVFYLPEGASTARHYKKGTTQAGGNYYGGPQQISGETLFKNPLVVKGATGGKAPENAYDSILGKGAYQKMRDDVMQVIGLYFDKPIREEAAERFLSQYAPEMSGMGWHIVQNSQKGNQLAYALQEAAVASAVRRAGHDGVLGYSTKRGAAKGESFLSEVFDVRENRYPDDSGGYSMWPEFDPNQ